MNQPVQNGMTPPPVPGILYYIILYCSEWTGNRPI